MLYLIDVQRKYKLNFGNIKGGKIESERLLKIGVSYGTK